MQEVWPVKVLDKSYFHWLMMCSLSQLLVHFTVACLPSLSTGVRLRLTLLWYKPYCFSNANYFVVMLTRYWSLLQHGYLHAHSKSKAWQLIIDSSRIYHCLYFIVNWNILCSSCIGRDNYSTGAKLFFCYLIPSEKLNQKKNLVYLSNILFS